MRLFRSPYRLIKGSLFIGLISFAIILESCKDPATEIIESPVFATDTTGDREIFNTILTYRIYKDGLYPYQFYLPKANMGFNPVSWDQEQNNKETHQKIFNLFAAIIPQEYRSEITYFSVMDGGGAYAAIGVQKRYSLESFNLSVQPDLLSYTDSIPAFKAPKFRHNTLGYGLAIYTMIHEFGHYVTMNNRQAYLKYFPDDDSYTPTPKVGSFIDTIRQTYWKPNLTEDILTSCFPKNGSFYFCFPAESFVSSYAGTTLAEDAAESFAHFVLMDEKPQKVTGATGKILLFYQDPQLVKLRLAIRQNLKKLGFAPKPANMADSK